MTTLKRTLKGALASLLFLLALGGCARLPQPAAPADLSGILAGEAILGHPVELSSLPDERLLALSPPMRDFLSGIAPAASPDRRLAALVRAFGQQGFSVEYDAGSTLSASETFHQQRGNCLAFTLMVVAMARELGADAYFNEVDVPPRWDSPEEQTFVVYRHINMVSEGRRGRRVVDFNLQAYDPLHDQRRLADSEAFALYYSNRAIELMQQDDEAEAFRHLRRALQLQPGRADLWSNLGALYSRAGHPQQAEQSYRQVLALDPGHLVAISNLERLYRADGRKALADTYARLAHHHRQRNPYYLYQRARSAYEAGQFQQARRQLRRALWQHGQDHRFHFLLGLTSLQLGDADDARASLRQAFQLVDNPDTEGAYRREVETLLADKPGGAAAAAPRDI